MKTLSINAPTKWVVLAAFLCLATSAHSQDNESLKRFEIGLRYMPTFTSFDFRGSNGDVIKGSFTLNQGAGLMLGFNFSKNIGIQGEINYYSVSQKYADQNISRDVDISYINIPVLLSLNTDKTMPVNLNVVVGPQFGYNVGAKISNNGNQNQNTTEATVAVKRGDIGVAYGAGLEIALNQSHTFRLDFGFRGFYGLVAMDGSKEGANTYNIVVNASRKSYGGYLGLALMF